MSCGEKIKLLRTQRGMGQAELGRATGLSAQTIYKYEKGIVSNIPLNSIIKIAKALNVDASEIVNWYEEVDEPALDDSLINMLTSLTPEESEKVIAFVQFLISSRK